MVALVLTVYAWGHRAIHATYDALSPFIHAIPNEWVAFDDERQEQLAICLLAVSFVLFNFGLFMSRQLKTDVDVQLIAAIMRSIERRSSNWRIAHPMFFVFMPCWVPKVRIFGPGNQPFLAATPPPANPYAQNRRPSRASVRVCRGPGRS